MLVLAGQDRMDKELMIGQMQGSSAFCSLLLLELPTDSLWYPLYELSQASSSTSSSITAAITSSRMTHADSASSSSNSGGGPAAGEWI